MKRHKQPKSMKHPWMGFVAISGMIMTSATFAAQSSALVLPQIDITQAQSVLIQQSLNQKKSEVVSQSTQPNNELGLNDDEAYVSDVKGYWTYTSLHYYRFTKYGNYGARVNSANRFGSSGKQYQLEANPTLPGSTYFQYLHLSAAYANYSQTLFPNVQYSIEPYFNLPKNFEASLGFNDLRTMGVNIYSYTGTLAYYLWNNYLWLRPSHYTPKSSDFFEVGARHYFSDRNTFVSLKAGLGKAPDILDLAPLNQIVVLQQSLIALNAQFPIHKNIYIQAGIGFIKQIFPSGNVREMTDANLGALWEF